MDNEQIRSDADGITQTESNIRLDDGRSLQVSEYGEPDGRPVVFFHGTPGSRVCIPDKAAVIENSVRFVTVDRPGYGGSDPNPGRTVLDWAADVEQLVDTLDIEQFAVAGLSGGGPHALACAVSMPDRVTNVAVISGVAPLDGTATMRGMNLYLRVGLLAARYTPFVLPIALRSMATQARENPESVIGDVGSQYAPSDRRVMSRDEVRAMMADELEATYRQGVDGHVADLRAIARDWEFGLDDIPVPVRIWHGGNDQNAPLSMAEHLAESIPDSHLTIFPDEGHLVAYEYFDRILNDLTSPQFR